MTDLISRADAIEAVANALWHYPNEQYRNLNDYGMSEALAKDALSALPSAKGGDAEMDEVKPQYMQASPSNGADLIRRADAVDALCSSSVYAWSIEQDKTAHIWALDIINALQSVDAVSREMYDTVCDEYNNLIYQLHSDTSTNTSTDTISRADAIEAVCSNCEFYSDCIRINDFMCVQHDALSSLPSAEAEPTQAERCEDCIHNDTNKDKITCKECASAEAVQGEWIKRGTKIKCSNCKSAWSTSFDTIIVGMKYCPMCGAKMTKGGAE